MYEYSREVYYYETDQMAVVHHSNFVRWLEEARTRYFAEVGLPYEVTESLGVLSPITGLEIEFKTFGRFGERFTVKLCMPKYTGVRFDIEFIIINQNGDTLARGRSHHAFVSSKTYRPVSLAKVQPHLHEGMLKCIEPEFVSK